MSKQSDTTEQGWGGLEVVKTPVNASPSGVFNLPTNFEIKRFQSRYVLEGDVQRFTSQRQPISGTNLTADAWSVFKNDKGEPHKVSLRGKETYVLLYRKIENAAAIDKVCADASRRLLDADIAGETIGGSAPENGILTDQQLKERNINDPKDVSDDVSIFGR